MNDLSEAYRLVFNDLTKSEGMFTGNYDAEFGGKYLMYGIMIAMEYLALRVSYDTYENFVKEFKQNIKKSEAKLIEGFKNE